MKNLKTFYYPESIEEALKILRNESVKTKIIAGGSSLAHSKDSNIEALLDITRIKDLKFIKEDVGYLVMGATTTVQDIVSSDLAKKLGNGILVEAARKIASRPLRNVITVGGNIVGVRVWSDLPTILLALDAQVKVLGDMERNIPAEDFFKDHPTRTLETDEIVTEVYFPMTPENSGSVFYKIGVASEGFAAMTLAVYLEIENGKCVLARIAVGSIPPSPRRCKEAEKMLEDQKIDDLLIQKAAEKARQETNTVTNIWASDRYRSEVLERMVKKALHFCLNKACEK